MNFDLVCPRDRTLLRSSGDSLVCVRQHAYPVLDGIPILLLADSTPTHSVAWRSLNPDRSDSPWYLETVGISDAERQQARDLIAANSPVDPVVSVGVGATSGFLYVDMIGKLTEYPIPELRLPTGNGQHLLDIGCNWGRWSIAAARKGYTVVGIDPSLGSLTAAGRVCRQLGVTADFIAADARTLPFPDNSFDVVFSFSVLQHLAKENAIIAFSEAGRVLRPGGIALIQMPNKFGVRNFYRQIRRGFRTPVDFEVRYWTVSELRRCFQHTVGPCSISVDGFFGLGVQPADARLMRIKGRAVIAGSEILRKAASFFSPLTYTADSIYVTAQKA